MLSAPKAARKRKPSAAPKAKAMAAPMPTAASAVPSFDAAAPAWPSGGLQKLNLD